MIWAFLPPDLRENFDIVKANRSDNSIDVWLDERREKSSEDAYNANIIGYGYTDYRRIQDHMAQGVPVYLYMRKCKWLNKETNEIFSYSIEYCNAPGTSLSQGLCDFLKSDD